MSMFGGLFTNLSYQTFLQDIQFIRWPFYFSKSEETECPANFIKESAKALELKAKINTTDKEIEQMVYQLYELTEEEIGMVENG